MRPETIAAIDAAIAETEPATQSPEELRVRAKFCMYRADYAASPEAERGDILRAIAYLVRRLELDAAGPG